MGASDSFGCSLLNQQTMKETIENLILSVNDNGVLKTAIELQKLSDELSELLNLIKMFSEEHIEEISQESEDYGGVFEGYEIKKRNGRKMISYKNVPEWKEAEKTKKQIEAKYKAMLSAIEKGLGNANISEDGEVLELPEVTYSKSGISYKKI